MYIINCILEIFGMLNYFYLVYIYSKLFLYFFIYQFHWSNTLAVQSQQLSKEKLHRIFSAEKRKVSSQIDYSWPWAETLAVMKKILGSLDTVLVAGAREPYSISHDYEGSLLWYELRRWQPAGRWALLEQKDLQYRKRYTIKHPILIHEWTPTEYRWEIYHFNRPIGFIILINATRHTALYHDARRLGIPNVSVSLDQIYYTNCYTEYQFNVSYLSLYNVNTLIHYLRRLVNYWTLGFINHYNPYTELYEAKANFMLYERKWRRLMHGIMPLKPYKRKNRVILKNRTLP